VTGVLSVFVNDGMEMQKIMKYSNIQNKVKTLFFILSSMFFFVDTRWIVWNSVKFLYMKLNFILILDVTM
jgi:hypothetical protein